MKWNKKGPVLDAAAAAAIPVLIYMGHIFYREIICLWNVKEQMYKVAWKELQSVVMCLLGCSSSARWCPFYYFCPSPSNIQSPPVATLSPLHTLRLPSGGHSWHCMNPLWTVTCLCWTICEGAAHLQYLHKANLYSCLQTFIDDDTCAVIHNNTEQSTLSGFVFK